MYNNSGGIALESDPDTVLYNCFAVYNLQCNSSTRTNQVIWEYIWKSISRICYTDMPWIPDYIEYRLTVLAASDLRVNHCYERNLTDCMTKDCEQVRNNKFYIIYI